MLSLVLIPFVSWEHKSSVKDTLRLVWRVENFTEHELFAVSRDVTKMEKATVAQASAMLTEL